MGARIVGVRQQAGAVDLALGLDPAVGAAAAALHRGDGLAGWRHAHQAAGQHAPGLRSVAEREDAQHDRARHDPAFAPGRLLGQRQIGLQGVLLGLLADALAQLAGGTAREGDGEHLRRQVVALGDRAQVALHQHGGLAGSGPGIDEDAMRRLDGGQLRRRRRKRNGGRRGRQPRRQEPSRRRRTHRYLPPLSPRRRCNLPNGGGAAPPTRAPGWGAPRRPQTSGQAENQATEGAAALPQPPRRRWRAGQHRRTPCD